MICSTTLYQFFKLMKVYLSDKDKDKFVAFGKKLNDGIDWERRFSFFTNQIEFYYRKYDLDLVRFMYFIDAYLIKVFRKYGVVKGYKSGAKVQDCANLSNYPDRVSISLVSVGRSKKRVIVMFWVGDPYNGVGVLLPPKGEPFSDGSLCKVWPVKDVKDFCVKLELLQQVLEERFKK